jgi:formylglycine-generating enzyme required for sulfatase activity
VTADTVVKKSGEKAECRSYFGLYDMSGNLQEWTDTRASENGRFNYVTGGFWNSGIKSSCRERRYSYFSQNKHNPVGFRCCKDIETTGQRRK